MKIGYARVSTKDQNLEIQTEALLKYGCEKIYEEKISSVKERPELENLLSILRKDDMVVVFKLDRLGRSLSHLINLMTLFKKKEVGFISLNDNIDTTTIQGRLVFNMFASFAEFEREIIVERTMWGLKRARENGKIGGRKKGLPPEAQKKALAAFNLCKANNELPREQKQSIEEMANIFGISRATYYRYLYFAKEEQIKRSSKKSIKHGS